MNSLPNSFKSLSPSEPIPDPYLDLPSPSPQVIDFKGKTLSLFEGKVATLCSMPEPSFCSMDQPLFKKRKEKASGVSAFTALVHFESQQHFRVKSKTFLHCEALKNEKTHLWIKEVLSQHFLFKEWNPFFLDKLIESLQKVTFKQDEVVVSADDSLSEVFLIEKGLLLERHLDSGRFELYGVGSVLGVHSIFCEVQKAVEIVAADPENVVWSIQFSKFQELLKELSGKELDDRTVVLDRVEYFDELRTEIKRELTYYMKEKKATGPATLLNRGEKNENLFVVKAGEIIIKFGDGKTKSLREFQVFGEEQLNEADGEMKYSGEVEKDRTVEYFIINKKSMRLILGGDYTKILYRKTLRKMILESRFFKFLDGISQERVVRALKIEERQVGKRVLGEEDWGIKVVFFLQGEARTEDGDCLMEKGKVYNEGVVVGEGETKRVGCVMVREGILGLVTLKKLKRILKTENLGEYFEGRKHLLKLKGVNEMDSPFLHMNHLHDDLKKIVKQIRLNKEYEHIYVLKQLGEGHFGMVLLVKIWERYFALKIISKAWIIQSSLQDYIIREKRICRLIDSPFIIHLDFTFKDDCSIYFLFEYINGLDLFEFRCKNNGVLPPSIVKFYVANLVLAIEYLHSKMIIHRDLKPENVMISETGYLKVIDLGAARLLLEDVKSSMTDSGSKSPKVAVNLRKAYTMIGTPDFTAPEMIKATGYSFPVDLWSLGVIIYELVCGFCPFGGPEDEVMDKYKSILQDKLRFPMELKDKRTKRLLKQLLSKSPEERLGGSFNALKANKWFNDINWTEIEEMKAKGPYLPKKLDLEKHVNKEKNLKGILEISKVEEFKAHVHEYDGWDEYF